MPEIEKITIMMVWFFTSLMGVLVFFFFLLTNKYRQILERKQKEALNNLIQGQDNERERISRDLHDQLGPQLNALAAIISSVKVEDKEISETLTDVKEELWKAQEDVRNISHDMMSTSLRKYGLIEALNKLAKRNQMTGIEVSVNHDKDYNELSDKQISHIFNISKELIYNTIKHSGAGKASFGFMSDPGNKFLTFTYEDNGTGNSNKTESEMAGIGLSNIRTRVKLMNGDCSFNFDKGFRAEIKIPY